MSWIEKDMKSGGMGMDSNRWKVLEQEKTEALPVVEKEITSGNKGIDPIEFQPVKSPGNYEAEFAIKGDDLIFHFWPSGYHEAESMGHAPPRFKREFSHFLIQAMSDTFGSKRIDIEPDRDMGAIFVKAKGFSSNQFYRNLAIEACELLHKKFES